MTMLSTLLSTGLATLFSTGLPALHLGGLHSYERLLVLLVAFGPFVVLGVVVYVVRRRDVAEDQRDAARKASSRREEP
jgi:phosphotransferase system  glucose/maltose/N-acetylglucosamine-specific IIC component